MNRKFIPIIIVLFILLSISVIAPSPVLQTGDFNEGLVVEHPLRNVLPQGKDYTINIHLFNRTNGYPIINSTISPVSCHLHIYNISGKHICDLNEYYFERNYDYEFTINGTNFTHVGTYRFLVQCNTSNAGGFYTETIYVTKTGKEVTSTDTTSGLTITLFLLIINAFIILLPFFKVFTKNEIANNVIKRSFWVIGIFLLMLNSSIVATVMYENGMPLTDQVFRYMILFGWAGYIMVGFLILKTLMEILHTWKLKKNKEKYGEDDEQD